MSSVVASGLRDAPLGRPMAGPGVRILRSGNRRDGGDGAFGRSGPVLRAEARERAGDPIRLSQCGRAPIRTTCATAQAPFPTRAVTFHVSWISMPRRYCRRPYSKRIRSVGMMPGDSRGYSHGRILSMALPPRSWTLTVRAGGYSSAIGKIRETTPGEICTGLSIMRVACPVWRESQAGGAFRSGQSGEPCQPSLILTLGIPKSGRI